ncbi:hypothetical protein [Mesorhizobium sp.]|uniref:phage adaptor protein n=1 Tax=Mesorhizobium sp. TaxID=1871066 RepID=UPI000FE90D9F|nr:hypothetical protein [Mesorhizobium sp.]RWG02573.1 MAG: hypothetical protein EOQ54_19665 [Mesorhizobium sp.]RWH00796.1 MAG: hypothetical protein EOQ72_09355 [Mesorhizobium sp.]TIN47591.1 MAG: hypothetical protein E5Y25_05215 [Mesorhizobium sp.]TIR92670.1 MAG: hypothetical protein E5X08_13485 [Mesorhizobium sp.]
MSILSVIKEVCPVIGLTVPTAVFSSTDREHVELQALANEMAKRIAFDTRDWTRLKVLATFTGDGLATAFNFPDDYHRMLKKARVWPSATPYTALTHYPDSDEWLGIQVQNFQPLVGAWTVVGEQMLIKPALPNLSTVQFFYLSSNIVKDKDGNAKASFAADDDVFRLAERVLKLGMIWQWKANKGMAYAEDMATYEDALAVSAGADKGSNILVVGRGRTPYDADIAFPGVIVP